MNCFSSYSSSILTVKHFPLIFNENDRQEFLQHFGAVRIRCLSRFHNLTNLIVADFGSHSQASQALVRLHQLEILARRLIVEYCPLDLAREAFTRRTFHEDFDPLLHGLSPGINRIRYSLPSERLSYSYPPIDENIMSNINNALVSTPSFYTQVLHLMNKMSLPCPMLTDSTKSKCSLSKTSVACQTDDFAMSTVISMDTDEDESEIDDGQEEERVKRHCRSLLRSQIRRARVATSDMTNTIDAEEKKKKKPVIELKLPQTLDQSRVDNLSSAEHADGFGRLEPTQTVATAGNVTVQEESAPPLPLIPLDELAKHRLSEAQLRLIDGGRLYRNYERGQPSQRLYIKNIEIKHVDERILHSIFDRYSSESFPIDIRLMRDGKMKGQAFVTFPNEQLAMHALNDTNGFVLHEKPLIVQFARSAKAKVVVE